LARPSSSFRVGALVLVGVLLTSCLELDVTVTLRTATSGTVEVKAFAHRLGKNFSLESVTFPTTRQDWETLVGSTAVAIPGREALGKEFTLTSFESVAEDRGVRTRTVLAFSSARGLENLFNSFSNTGDPLVSLTLIQDPVTMRQNLIVTPRRLAKIAGLPAQTKQTWNDLWGDLTWTFRFVPPAPAVPVLRTLTLAELVAEAVPAPWRASW